MENLIDLCGVGKTNHFAFCIRGGSNTLNLTESSLWV